MTDWRGYRLNGLAALEGPVLESALSALRAWTDASSPVGPGSGVPDGRTHALREADDLLHVPSDRRDACFAELVSFVRWLRATEADPTEYVRAMLAHPRAPETPFPAERLAEASRGTGAVSRAVTLRWTDDGRNDLGQDEIKPSFTF